MTGGTGQLFAGRYRLDRRLGVGGMSTVQLAFDTRLERYVAVKLLAEHLAADNNFVARFRREALAAARLVHPNVVQVYDFGTDQASGRQFIVMEHVDGRSCAELLRDAGHLGPREVVEICAQACRGLDYAHRNGVVHRDVKPGNLLQNPEGVVKLADFGIAKAAEDSDITRVGSVIGTAAYLSPEQARGEPAGPASDLYALGVVAYQLATGRLPYQGASLTDLARQQESGPPTDVHQIAPEVSEALSAAIMRALESDPARRYASASEMEDALRDAQRGIAPPPLPPRTSSGDPTVALGREDTTRVLGRTEATRAATGTGAPARRRLEPLPSDQVPVRRRRQEPEPGRRRNTGRTLFTLLILAAALGAIAFGAIQISKLSNQPQIRQVGGDLQQTLQELRQTIQDNTQ
jgi:serine/threonine-protein kinase